MQFRFTPLDSRLINTSLNLPISSFPMCNKQTNLPTRPFIGFNHSDRNPIGFHADFFDTLKQTPHSKDDIPIALGLLVSQLSDEPWKGQVTSHGDCPEMHFIQGDDVRYKCESVRRLLRPINPYRNFGRLFDMILGVDVNEKLKPEHMIRKVIVFSHRDYDHSGEYCTSSTRKTEYDAVHTKFEDKGYGNVVVPMPHILFWTLSEYQPAKPCMQPAFTIFSGFSNDLLKLFLANGNIGPTMSWRRP